jgi:hypothetical protein
MFTLSIFCIGNKMKYYMCSICNYYHRVLDSHTFECRYCGCDKGTKLTKREYEGKPK